MATLAGDLSAGVLYTRALVQRRCTPRQHREYLYALKAASTAKTSVSYELASKT